MWKACLRLYGAGMWKLIRSGELKHWYGLSSYLWAVLYVYYIYVSFCM